jgi:hypothetical protein
MNARFVDIKSTECLIANIYGLSEQIKRSGNILVYSGKDLLIDNKI